MKIKKIIGTVVGSTLLLLGLLWLLQGSDLLHIKPILCVAQCEIVTGYSLQWQLIGGIVAIIGLKILSRAVNSKK